MVPAMTDTDVVRDRLRLFSAPERKAAPRAICARRRPHLLPPP